MTEFEKENAIISVIKSLVDMIRTPVQVRFIMMIYNNTYLYTDK